MTNMTAMPIYGNRVKKFFLKSSLGMEHRGLELILVCSNDAQNIEAYDREVG